MSSYWTIQNFICLINNYLIMNVIKQLGEAVRKRLNEPDYNI